MVVSGIGGKLYFAIESDESLINIPIYGWYATYGQTTRSEFWSIGDNLPIQLFLPYSGRLTFSGPGIDIDEKLIIPSSQYVIFRCIDAIGNNSINLLARPTSIVYTMLAQATNMPALSFTANYEIVGYAPRMTESGPALENNDVCRPGHCGISLTFDTVTLPTWNKVEFTLTYGPYDAITTYRFVPIAILPNDVIAKQTNRGTMDVSAKINFQDSFIARQTPGFFDVSIPTGIGARFWRFKWLTFSDVDNVNVNVNTGEIVNLSTLYKYTKMNQYYATGNLYLPSGTVL